MALAAGLTAGATLGIATGQAGAATFNVSSLDDSGPGSLREALDNANLFSPGPDTITFATGLSGQIDMAGGSLPITDPVDIQGPGAGVITINGGGGRRIFLTNMATAGDPVTISGLTLAGGKAPNAGSCPN